MARKHVACTRSLATSRALDKTSAYRQRRARAGSSPARTSRRLASLMAPLELTRRSSSGSAAYLRARSEIFIDSSICESRNGFGGNPFLILIASGSLGASCLWLFCRHLLYLEHDRLTARSAASQFFVSRAAAGPRAPPSASRRCTARAVRGLRWARLPRLAWVAKDRGARCGRSAAP